MPHSHYSPTLIQSPRPKPVVTTSRPKVEEEDFNDYEYQSLDYDYYYDQLVPEHERFFQVHHWQHTS